MFDNQDHSPDKDTGDVPDGREPGKQATDLLYCRRHTGRPGELPDGHANAAEKNRQKCQRAEAQRRGPILPGLVEPAHCAALLDGLHYTPGQGRGRFQLGQLFQLPVDFQLQVTFVL